MDPLATLGLFAVTAMMFRYALEPRSHSFILAFAMACAIASLVSCDGRSGTSREVPAGTTLSYAPLAPEDLGTVAPLLNHALERVRELPVPPDAAKLATSESAAPERPDRLQVRRELRQGNIETLKAYLPALHRRYEAGEVSEFAFYAGLVPLYARLPEALPALDRWVAESPHEYVAWLARGIVRSDLGWDYRGIQYPQYTPKADLREMRRWHALAARDFQSSIELSSRPVPSIVGLISLAQASGAGDEGRQLYREGARLAPSSAALFNAFKPMLYEEWGGRTIAYAEAVLGDAKKRGVPARAWSDLQRTIDNAQSGNRYSHDQKAAREYLVGFTARYGTFDGWLRRGIVERELRLLEDATRSMDRAADLAPDEYRLHEERGVLYEHRRMLPEAIADYRRAAEFGSDYAQERLIAAYASGGLGFNADFAKARPICEESAAMHNPAGEYCLGWFHRAALGGLPADPVQAAKWERLVAHHSHAAAANDFGTRLMRGDGIPADLDEAVFWLRRAVRGGYDASANKLRELGVPEVDPSTQPSSFDILWRQIKWRFRTLFG